MLNGFSEVYAALLVAILAHTYTFCTYHSGSLADNASKIALLVPLVSSS